MMMLTEDTANLRDSLPPETSKPDRPWLARWR